MFEYRVLSSETGDIELQVIIGRDGTTTMPSLKVVHGEDKSFFSDNPDYLTQTLIPALVKSIETSSLHEELVKLSYEENFPTDYAKLTELLLILTVARHKGWLVVS